MDQTIQTPLTNAVTVTPAKTEDSGYVWTEADHAMGGPWGERWFTDHAFALEQYRQGLLNQYTNQWVAFLNKTVVDADSDKTALRTRLQEKWGIHPNTVCIMLVE